MNNTHYEEMQNIDRNQNADLLKSLKKVLEISDILLDNINKQELDESNLDDLKKISLSFLSHTYQIGCSIYHFSILNHGTSVSILLRALLDSLIDLAYLFQSDNDNSGYDEKRAWLMFQYYSFNTRINNSKIMDLLNENDKRDIQDCSKNFKTYLDNKPIPDKKAKEEKNESTKKEKSSTHWAIKEKIEQRAKQVDESKIITNISLDYEYQLIYRWASQYVHGTSAGIFTVFREEEDIIDFRTDFNSNNVDLVLIVSLKYMYFIYTIINKVFNLNINVVELFENSGVKVDFATDNNK